MKLVFTGIQWCWKWTQARILEEKKWFKLLEMWGSLRAIAESNTPLWNEVKQTIESGKLVSPEIVWKVIKQVIENETHEHIILDWFVRNKGNQISLDEVCDDYTVIFFQLSKEKAISRLLWRMYDKETGETFPPWTVINPHNGNELEKRKDDNQDAILERIDQFIEHTLPVVEEQKKKWKVIEINADQNPQDVYNDIVKALWL